MPQEPVVNPNAVAVELFREIAASVRRLDDKQDAMGEKIDLARQELAEVRGAEIPEALRAIQAENVTIKSRLDKLEEAERTRAAVARPWLAGLKEIGKALLPYAMAGALLLLGLKELKPS